ncbi:MAG: hypothetical protein CFH40_01625 [Alphaproteobacteria bacterium MarineAlpha10_Bin3]|jgi:NitT/TauT family transport system substrate-binding protein|nr:MAG: hypothetical protein CFH40_01625 [Alphaproteobacteria bacterium MarineAlpha10_Bin3]PPR70078.1 MAG: hypothetical protein CFH09_01625 [Alphaproteobacteria bacterium MarineAlpha4_Bin1]
MAITLFETFRAVFYTPFYAAHALDAYGAEGVDVELKTPSGPEQTASGLLSGATDVSWGGPMRIQLTYDQNPDCGLVAFCEAVTRDPFFVIGREPRANFQLRDLIGPRIGTVAEVPTPWMCLQEDLRAHGLDPAMVERVGDQTMAANEAALRIGSLDAIQVFQPYAEHLIRDGIGHIWYAAATRGPCAYTTLYTTRRMLNDDPQSLLAMTRAIYRTQIWLHATPDAEVAKTIASFFPDLAPEILIACIARYRSLGIWNTNPVLPRNGFDLLRQSCLSGGLIATGADYETCVDTSLARQAIAADPPSM